MGKGASKRMGRPIKPPTPGERVALSLRVTAEIKEKLEQTAVVKGRSLSQEAEFRLGRSFETQSLLTEVLTLAYGERLADLLAELGDRLLEFDEMVGAVRKTQQLLSDGDHDHKFLALMHELELLDAEALPKTKLDIMRGVLDILRDYFGTEIDDAISFSEADTEVEGDNQ